jgi:hypothetical protein
MMRISAKRIDGKYIVTVKGFKAVFDRREDAFNYYLFRRTINY